jgi:hypothetical protein
VFLLLWKDLFLFSETVEKMKEECACCGQVCRLRF